MQVNNNLNWDPELFSNLSTDAKHNLDELAQSKDGNKKFCYRNDYKVLYAEKNSRIWRTVTNNLNYFIPTVAESTYGEAYNRNINSLEKVIFFTLADIDNFLREEVEKISVLNKVLKTQETEQDKVVNERDNSKAELNKNLVKVERDICIFEKAKQEKAAKIVAINNQIKELDNLAEQELQHLGSSINRARLNLIQEMGKLKEISNCLSEKLEEARAGLTNLKAQYKDPAKINVISRSIEALISKQAPMKEYINMQAPFEAEKIKNIFIKELNNSSRLGGDQQLPKTFYYDVAKGVTGLKQSVVDLNQSLVEGVTYAKESFNDAVELAGERIQEFRRQEAARMMREDPLGVARAAYQQAMQ